MVFVVMSLSVLWTWTRKYGIYKEIGKSTIYTVFFYIAGIGLTYLRKENMPAPFLSDEAIYKCVITEEPYFKGKTYRCTVDVLERMDSVEVDAGSRAILYMANTDMHASLMEGDVVYVNASLSLPENNEGYSSYLYRNGICGTGYVADGDLYYIGHIELNDLSHLAGKYRQKVYEWYRDLGFSGDELAVFAALTLGVKDDISDELRDDYSIAGVSHVLALSGLHVGMIFVVFMLLFRIFRTHTWVRFLIWLVMVCSLVCFSIFTGLSPSVIRASFMMAIVGLNIALVRHNTSLNALFLVAFCLLLYDPFYIYNVSFLMSFSAVLFILLFYWPLYTKVSLKANRVLRYVYGLFILSVVAQAGVAPIVAYCFGTFSVYGVLASVIIVPLLTLTMYFVVAMIALMWNTSLFPLILLFVNIGLSSINAITVWFSTLPFASVGNISLSYLDVLLYYCTVVSLLIWIINKYHYQLRYFLVFVCCWMAVMLYSSIKQYNTSAIVVKNEQFRTICRFENGFDRYVFVTDSCDSVNVRGEWYWQYGNVACLGDKMIMYVSEPLYNLPVSERKIHVDYLWLSKGVKGSFSNISGTYVFDSVILDSSLSPYYRKMFAEESGQMGIDVIDMSSEDEYTIDCKE